MSSASDFAIENGVLKRYTGSGGDVVIPEGVRSIGEAAFCDNQSLTSVVIPEGTTSIEFNAFEGCTNLTSITFPETIITISDLTFDSCKALASLIIPESVTTIGYEAFADCDNLTSIVIKGDITSIEQAAFSRCKKLKNITISVASLKKCKDTTVWKVASETLPISSLVQALTKAPKNCKKKIEEKLIKSEDLSVIRYFAGQGRLEEYAAVRGLDADELLDSALSDFGLNKDGSIHWTFAGKIITAKLENDLTITLWDKDGNALKSIPKRGVDLEEYNSVKKALTQLKKDISTTAKQLSNRLLADWLTARPQKSTIWQSAYLVNLLLRKVGNSLVWSQEGNTFLPTENGVITSKGTTYVFTNGEIVLAHPMEMQTEDLKAWQKYFTAHGIRQPFEQIWEPVVNASEIKPDRYKDCWIPYYRFKDKDKHGIHVKDEDFHNFITISLDDCEAVVERDAWSRHKLSMDDRFAVQSISVPKLTRKANHIISYLDRVTIYSRIEKDDTGIAQFLHCFTLAQITEFLKIAEENDCTNVKALLLDFKNQNYADFDPMEEFALEG